MTDQEARSAATPPPGITSDGLSTPDGNSGWEIKGGDALVVRGLLYELPPVGAVWSEEDRKAWTNAMLAAFAVLYEDESHG